MLLQCVRVIGLTQSSSRKVGWLEKTGSSHESKVIVVLSPSESGRLLDSAC